MLYFNTNSRQKIVHTAACFHILHTDIERIGSFDTPMQAVKCGYRFCKHCNRLAQQYRREEPAILNACLRLGLSVQMCAACIEIVSPFSRWKLLMDETGRGLDLYHKNTVNLGRQRLRCCGIPSAGGRKEAEHCGFSQLYCGARCFPQAQSHQQKTAAEIGKGAAEEGHAPLQKFAETRQKRGAQTRHRQCHVAV